MKKKTAVLFVVIALLCSMLLLTGHASGLMENFGKKEKTVTISQEE